MSDIGGSNVKRLTANEDYDAEISVSPDGKRIVFTHQVEDKRDVWMMNARGTTGEHFMSDLITFVMDISSLDVGPSGK